MINDVEYYTDENGAHCFRCAHPGCKFRSHGWPTLHACMARASEHHNEHSSADALRRCKNELRAAWDVLERTDQNSAEYERRLSELEEARMRLIHAEGNIQFMTALPTFKSTLGI